MMTPEQQELIHAELSKFGGEWWTGVATPRIIAIVNNLLAQERAATVERCVAWLASAQITTTQQENALRAAIRQGGGNG